MAACSAKTKPFLNEMVFAVRDLMQDAYPELKESAERVSKAVLAEETRFAHTRWIVWAEESYEEQLESACVRRRSKNPQAIVALFRTSEAFRLYDTFGLPLDFMQDAVRDQGLGV